MNSKAGFKDLGDISHLKHLMIGRSSKLIVHIKLQFNKFKTKWAQIIFWGLCLKK